MDLAQELANVRAAIKRTQDNERRKRKTAARVWVLVPALLRVVLTRHWLAEGVVDTAVLYLQQRCRQRHWPEKSKEEIAGVVHELFVGCTR